VFCSYTASTGRPFRIAALVHKLPTSAAQLPLLIEQLRHSLGLLTVAFNASQEAMLILDGQQRIQWANQQAASRWGNGLAITLIGKSLPQVLELLDQAGAPLAVAAAPEGAYGWMQGDGGCRCWIREDQSAAGSLQPQQLHWRQVKEVSGGFVLLTLRNLAPAEQALADKQLFLNQLAHELRTPLAVLMGGLQRLESAVPEPEHPALQQMRSEARGISRTLDQLQWLLQLQDGVYPCHVQNHCLVAQVQQWCDRLESDRGCPPALQIAPAAVGMPVPLDALALERMLDQLLDHGRKCGAEADAMRLCIDRVENSLQLRFVDGVPGLPADHFDAVFDAGYSGGIGLALVRALAERQNIAVQLLAAADLGISDASTVVELRFALADA